MRKIVFTILLSGTILSLLAINSFGESSAALSPPEREIDGSMNHPSDLGQADDPLRRFLSVGYEGGKDNPRGDDPSNLPSARAISNAVSAQSSSVIEPSGASDMFWLWGQFVDHDMDLTGGLNPAVDFNILVPTGDPDFDPNSEGGKEIGLNRSVFTLDGDSVRQQLNQITAFIDGSNVYGSDSVRNSFIRANDGSGKLVVSSGNLLPFNDGTQVNAGGPGTTLFVAGDVRANEHVALTAMHTIFVREHNKIVDEIVAKNPNVSFTGDELYNKAKRILEGKIQYITYNEFLPILLGPNAITPWSSYTGVDPRVTNEFSTAAYRFGHTMLSTELERRESNGDPSPGGHLSLDEAFFSPSKVNSIEVDRLMRGLAGAPAQKVDTLVIDDIRNFLFGPPGAGGFDLASLNIQRGREHGLPSYNQARTDLGLSQKTSYLQITGENSNNSPIADGLEAVYETGNVDDVDLWTGGLAEPRVSGSIVGETFLAILTDQFQRSMDGDLYWYENRYAEGDLTDMELMMIETSSLANIIMRNTGIQFINQDVYLVDESTLEDSDFDTVMNYLDNCKDVSNEDQLDINANGFGDVCEPQAVGGEMILVDTTVLLLAGTQYMGAWLIPVLVSAVGLGIVILRKF